MELTKKEIEKLYEFTQKHYVEYYDVQMELVDHLANNIEEDLEENPNLSFKEARDKSFKKFGVFGFMKVVESKQKAMNKRYIKILWQFFRDWFTIPKIIITLTIFSSFYTLLYFNISKNIFLTVLFLLAIIDIILAIKLIKKANTRFKKEKRKYLLEDFIFKTGSFISIIAISNLVNLINFLTQPTSIYYKLLLASLITLVLLFSYISLIIIPQKATELLKETYSEYKFLKM